MEGSKRLVLCTSIESLCSVFPPFRVMAERKEQKRTTNEASQREETKRDRCGWQEIALYSDTGNVITFPLDCYAIRVRLWADVFINSNADYTLTELQDKTQDKERAKTCVNFLSSVCPSSYHDLLWHKIYLR